MVVWINHPCGVFDWCIPIDRFRLRFRRNPPIRSEAIAKRKFALITNHHRCVSAFARYFYQFCLVFTYNYIEKYIQVIITMLRRVILEARNQVGRLNNVRFFAQEVNETEKIEKTVNNVTLLGRVGAEPQKRGTAEHPVVIFSLATHTNYKYGTGDFMQRTDWHKVCVFRPNLRDSVYTYLKKGQRVMVNGRISYSEFKDEAGNPHPSTAIIADDVIFFQ